MVYELGSERGENLALHTRRKGTRGIIPLDIIHHGVWFGSASMGMIPLYIRLYISSLWELRSLQQLSGDQYLHILDA
jgi:hypothetical protein